MSELSTFIEQFNTIKQQMKKDAKRLISAHISEAVKEATRDIVAVRWRQYTPGFNDGEPCLFRLSEVCVRIKGMLEDEGDDEDGFVSLYGIDKGNTDLREQVKKIASSIESIPEEFMQSAFGDGVEVTLSRLNNDSIRITVDDYDCGY